MVIDCGDEIEVIRHGETARAPLWVVEFANGGFSNNRARMRRLWAANVKDGHDAETAVAFLRVLLGWPEAEVKYVIADVFMSEKAPVCV